MSWPLRWNVPLHFCYNPKGRKRHQCNVSILLAWYWFVPRGFTKRGETINVLEVIVLYMYMNITRIHMEHWQNCEENELRPVNNWIATSTTTVTNQLLSESRLPVAQQENNISNSHLTFNWHKTNSYFVYFAYREQSLLILLSFIRVGFLIGTIPPAML